MKTQNRLTCIRLYNTVGRNPSLAEEIGLKIVFNARKPNEKDKEFEKKGGGTMLMYGKEASNRKQ